MKKIVSLAVFTMFSLVALSQGTAFTYQGQLTDGGAAANGSYDFRLRLASDSQGNVFVAGPLLTNAVPVSGGLFLLSVDFGDGIFTGSNFWLQVDVRTNNAASYTTLTPLQALTPAPYAIFANTASNVSGTLAVAQLSGTLLPAQLSGAYSEAVTFSNAANSLSGSFSGNGSGLSNINAATLGSLNSAAFWKTNGNTGANPASGAFIGSRDNLPMEFRVNNERALRLEPDTNGVASNLIGGSSGNSVKAGLTGTTIGGGDNNIITYAGDPVFASDSVISGGYANLIGSTPATGTSAVAGANVIGGGSGNNIRFNGSFNTIGGGSDNVISTNADWNFLGGGNLNTISVNDSTVVIGGGSDNSIGTNAFACFIGGGSENAIASSAMYAMIPGGNLNTATNYAFAAGRRAKANHQGAFVWADSQDADFASTAANQFIIRAAGGVGIGTGSPTRELEVQNAGDTEIGIRSADTGGHLWTLQSSLVSGSPNLDASFQIIDRTTGVNLSRLLIGTNGNVGIGTTNPTNRLHVVGGITCTALVQTSDRNAKENFAPVSPGEVLAKVAALPISTWNFKEMHDGRHLGPMAQDFYAAFHLGGADTTITAVDTEGVALSAIQGLNQKLEEQRSELSNKEAEIAELKQRLEKLELLVSRQNPDGNEREERGGL